MADNSPRLALPFLAPAQAQKHVTHNAALTRLDILVQLSVEAFDALQPPAVPEEGAVYALGSGAQEAFAGQDGRLAAFQDGAWVFIAPEQGWIASHAESGALRVFQDGAWRLLPLYNLDGVGVNAAFDATNRLAVAADATLLTHDGGGHQLKINKATAADTASLLFQSGYDGRAEMGLAGTDAFALKVSDDGSTWREALRADPASGSVTVQKRFFSLGRSTNQGGIPDKSHTVLMFDDAISDTAGVTDPALGRLTPPAGAVSAIAGTYVTGLTPGGICTIGVWKNGALLTQKIYYAAASGDIGMDVALQDSCAAGDYYEIRLYVSSPDTATANNNPANTYWRGFHH